jgi:hypothetical protein
MDEQRSLEITCSGCIAEDADTNTMTIKLEAFPRVMIKKIEFLDLLSFAGAAKESLMEVSTVTKLSTTGGQLLTLQLLEDSGLVFVPFKNYKRLVELSKKRK